MHAWKWLTHLLTIPYDLPITVALVSFTIGTGVSIVVIARAVRDAYRYERDRKNPNLRWSRIHVRYVEKFGGEHIGEALFWGNRLSQGGTLGMNGVEE